MNKVANCGLFLYLRNYFLPNPEKFSNFAALNCFAMRHIYQTLTHGNAMKKHGVWATCFDAFSSKNSDRSVCLNNYKQSYSGDYRRCSFTGKERDEETGYGYFGARYMDHELMTMWLSVDPMSDKYPSISPYAYCAWNPVKLVDPDGREWDPASLAIINKFRKDTEYARDNATTEEQRKELQNALDELDVLSRPGGQMYHIEYGNTSNYNKKGETDYDIENDRVRIIISYDGETGDIAHELKHAYQFETGDLSFDSQTGGCARAVLYDLTDEESAYRRGAAYGVAAPMSIAWNEKFQLIHRATGECGFYYPFLPIGAVKLPNLAGGKDYPASAKDIHGRNNSTNNIYRYEGKTYYN